MAWGSMTYIRGTTLPSLLQYGWEPQADRGPVPSDNVQREAVPRLCMLAVVAESKIY